MSRHNILREIEENVRDQYFCEGLRYPDSVLNEKNYLDVKIEKLYKYGYYDPVNKILDDAALLKDEGVVKEYFIDQRDRLIDESQKDILTSFENRLILNEAIKKLEYDEQQLIILNYFEGLNQREISQKLDMSQMQVSRKLKKALDKLFNLITKKGMHKYEH